LPKHARTRGAVGVAADLPDWNRIAPAFPDPHGGKRRVTALPPVTRLDSARLVGDKLLPAAG